MHNVSSAMTDGFSWLLSLASILTVNPSTPVVEREYTIGLNEQQTLASPGFPDHCCNPAVYTIRYQGRDDTEATIRLLFTDLDIEPGSFIRLYDGPDDSSPAFTHQPELVSYYRVGNPEMSRWSREGIQSSGPYIYIQYVPKTSGLRAKNYYRGFKLVYWASKSNKEDWITYPTSEHCPFIRPAELGGIIALKPPPTVPRAPNPAASHVLDCVWQVKLPQEAGKDWKVYIRFTALDFAPGDRNFEIKVVDSATSTGTPVFVYGRYNATTTLEASVQPLAGYVSDGLYVRLRIPVAMENFLIRFVYGMFVPIEDCALGPGIVGGVPCAHSNMCVPGANVCDGIANCQDASDEVNQRCTVKTTTVPNNSTTVRTTPTTSPPKTSTDTAGVTDPCPLYRQVCPDGSCADYLWECPDACQWRCNNGKCIDVNRERCPEDACPLQKPFRCDGGETCIYEDYVCDGDCDCHIDCADEDNCHNPDSWPLSKLLFMLIPLATIAVLIYVGHRYYVNKTRADSPGRQAEYTLAQRGGSARSPPSDRAVDFSGTRMRPAATAGAYPRQAHLMANGETVIPLMPIPIDEPASPQPPPSYDEVIHHSTNYPTPPLQPGGIAAPPAYESVSHIQPKEL